MATTIPKQMRVTVVQVHLPWWARLFRRTIFLGVRGLVDEVALLDRHEARAIFEQGYRKQWMPYQANRDTEPPPSGPGG